MTRQNIARVARSLAIYYFAPMIQLLMPFFALYAPTQSEYASLLRETRQTLFSCVKLNSSFMDPKNLEPYLLA
jgi:hypothetical protein